MLEKFLREYREMLEKLRLYLENVILLILLKYILSVKAFSFDTKRHRHRQFRAVARILLLRGQNGSLGGGWS